MGCHPVAVVVKRIYTQPVCHIKEFFLGYSILGLGTLRFIFGIQFTKIRGTKKQKP